VTNANLYSTRFTAVNVSLRSVNVIVVDVTADTDTNGSSYSLKYSSIFSAQKYFKVQYILPAA